MYRIREFAALAGVTVRTLHHYDRLQLLRPRRTASGYRMYCDRDLERLEQIVALKFIGLPLERIRVLLDRETLHLADALRQQHRVLKEKTRLLDRALDAIHEAESALCQGQGPLTAALKRIIEVMEMQSNSDWMMKYYSPEAREKIEERKAIWSPELQAETEKAWKDLIADVEASLNEDPASPKAQALADRWKALVEAFTGGDPKITEGLKSLYQDQTNWPSEFRQQMQPFVNPAVSEYIGKAMAARK